MNNNRVTQEVNVMDLRQKVGSKKELYDFLSQDCGAYLPKMNCTNVYFLRSILNGEKEYLKRTEVMVAAVPQIEGLSVQDFIDYAKNKPSLVAYLPDQCDWLHLDKRWLTDVLLTLDKDGISKMIEDAKKDRRHRLDQSQSLLLPMRSEFVQALQQSASFSVQKGRSAYLMKPGSKRKGKANQIEELKQADNSAKPSKSKYLDTNKRIREEVSEMESQIAELNNYKNLVMHLHSEGIIDQAGNPMVAQRNPSHPIEFEL